MKTMGLIGGMSWESTAIYYRLINEDVKARLGGHHSAKLLLYSVDFAEIEEMQKANRWGESGILLADAAQRLARAGAEFIVLCTNTMHKVASTIEDAVSIPLLHIADPTAEAIQSANIRKVGLLATRFTMEQDFYAQRLREKHNIDVIVPEKSDRDEVHRVIYEELVHGKIKEDSRRSYLGIVEHLRAQGAQAIILGCTEIGMLIGARDVGMPCFDTTELHARRAVDYALS